MIVVAASLVPASAALTTGCASTGSTPRPFPTPAGTHAPPASPGSRPNEGAAGRRGSYDTYALVGTALALRGAPYRNGGSDPNGFDCSGFTKYVFGQHGIDLPRAVTDQYQRGRQVAPHDIAPGDLVFFTTTDPGASHVGIVVGGDEFVHAPSSTGVVRVERISAPYWSGRYVGARRME